MRAMNNLAFYESMFGTDRGCMHSVKSFFFSGGFLQSLEQTSQTFDDCANFGSRHMIEGCTGKMHTEKLWWNSSNMFALFIHELLVRFVIGLIVMLNIKFPEHWFHLLADKEDRFICPLEVRRSRSGSIFPETSFSHQQYSVFFCGGFSISLSH